MKEKFALPIFIFCLFVLSIVSYKIYRSIISGYFKELNYTIAKSETSIALAAYSRRVESIEKMNVDWSQWDDSYQFIQDRNENYIQTNLTDESLQGSNINLILYFNRSGDIVYKKALSLGSFGDTTIPAEVFRHTSGNDKIDVVELVKDGRQRSGILYTSAGTFLYSVNKITSSDGIAEPKGALMMARYINDLDIQELRKSTGLDLDMIDYTDVGRFYEGVTLKELEKDVVYKEKNGTITAHVLARDSWGDPAKVITIRHAMIGYDYLYSLTMFITYVSVILAMIFSQVVSRFIYNPKLIVSEKK